MFEILLQINLNERVSVSLDVLKYVSARSTLKLFRALNSYSSNITEEIFFRFFPLNDLFTLVLQFIFPIWLLANCNFMHFENKETFLNQEIFFLIISIILFIGFT